MGGTFAHPLDAKIRKIHDILPNLSHHFRACGDLYLSFLTKMVRRVMVFPTLCTPKATTSSGPGTQGRVRL
jgi:hypothetical protein